MAKKDDGICPDLDQMLSREDEFKLAVKLGGFRVPYSFPFPPSTADLGLYKPSLYAQYINFINLGLRIYSGIPLSILTS